MSIWICPLYPNKCWCIIIFPVSIILNNHLGKKSHVQTTKPPKGLDMADSRLCQSTQVLISQGVFFCKGEVLAWINGKNPTKMPSSLKNAWENGRRCWGWSCFGDFTNKMLPYEKGELWVALWTYHLQSTIIMFPINPSWPSYVHQLRYRKRGPHLLWWRSGFNCPKRWPMTSSLRQMACQFWTGFFFRACLRRI